MGLREEWVLQQCNVSSLGEWEDVDAINSRHQAFERWNYWVNNTPGYRIIRRIILDELVMPEI